jgi:hypothetical protein
LPLELVVVVVGMVTCCCLLLLSQRQHRPLQTPSALLLLPPLAHALLMWHLLLCHPHLLELLVAQVPHLQSPMLLLLLLPWLQRPVCRAA